MLSPKVEQALNKQVNAELYSAYMYLSMSAYFESLSFKGMANWMRIQAQEELTHAMKLFDFINDRNGRVVLGPIEGPKTHWDSPLQAFEDTLLHETHVTSLIYDLMNLSQAEKDHAAHNFLEWFVNEQVEEEASARQVVDKLKLAGDHGVALLLIDTELGQRTPEPTA